MHIDFSNHQWLIILITTAAGSLIPTLFGMILPRKKTVQYGMLINRFLGTVLFQKRIWGKTPDGIVQAIGHCVQTTFQDLSYGVYLDSREDITAEDKAKKVDEYLAASKGLTS